MTNRRILLHEKLCRILGCPTEGTDCRCYFQPPESVRMKYPAIVYSLDDIANEFANDAVYLSNRRYAAILIDKNPDSEFVGELAAFPLCQFNRSYSKDNLNHYVFEIYF